MVDIGGIQNIQSEPDKALREQVSKDLENLYGIDTVTGAPIWRVSWSEDQFEKRHGTFHDFTEGGIYLRTVTETRLVPKYRQWIQKLYVLERLVGTAGNPELTTNISYEPIFPFWNFKGEYLPPRTDVASLVINGIYAKEGKASLRKYVDPDADGENGLQAKAKRVQEMYDYLWGNETSVNTSLAHGEGVSLSGPKFTG